MMVSYEGMEGGADADGQDFPQRRRQEVEVEDENNVVDGDGVAVVKIGIIAWDCPKPPKVYQMEMAYLPNR